MGASVSVQNIDVSFVDKKGNWLSDKEIKTVIEKVQFDFSKGFYDQYKNPNAYMAYSKHLPKQI